MAYEKKPNTGSLFINDKKQMSTQPDLRGSLRIDKELIKSQMANGEGYVDVSVSAWNNKSPKGLTYLSLAASAPYVAPQQDNKQPWER